MSAILSFRYAGPSYGGPKELKVGARGVAGRGVPAGGTDGQVLAKASDTDYDTEWVEQTGGGGGAPTSASYVVLGTNGTLTNERVLTAGSGVSLTDGGAGSTLTVANTDRGSAAVTAHVAESDPHSQYTTALEAAAAAPVQSVAGKTGNVTLTTADVQAVPLDGSTAMTGDLSTTGVRNANGEYGFSLGDGQTDFAGDVTTDGAFYGNGANLAGLTVGQVSGAAPLASPALTGTPTAPTATGGTNTTQIATTAFVQTAIGGLSSTYQPLDSDLTAIAALTTTSFGRSLLTLADAAALRTTAGLSTTSRTVFASSPSDSTLVIEAKARFAFSVQGLYGLKLSSGSLTLKVQVNGTDVTGLTGLSVTTSAQDVTASGSNTVSVGDRVTLVISSSSSPANLELTLQAVR